MHPERLGRAVRVLRRRRHLTQAQLGVACGLSQAAISRIESGHAPAYTWAALARVAESVGAHASVTIYTSGDEVDRLLDRDHAAIVEWTVGFLRGFGWEVAPEVTFSVYGERGSIDVLAFHPPTGSLLVIEVKSLIPDVQGTLSGLDRKFRLARRIAAERGWAVRTVSRWLVVPGDRTTRRRIARHAATFDAVVPARTPELRRWGRRPVGTCSGIFHVPDATLDGPDINQADTPRPELSRSARKPRQRTG